MPVRISLAIVIILAGFLFIRWFTRTPSQVVARKLRQALLFVLIAILIYLALTGRLHWLFAAIAALLPFARKLLPLVRFLPLFNKIYKRYKAGKATGFYGNNTGKTSQVQARFVRMSLDHDSGKIDGKILEGEHEGQLLSKLKLEQLVALLDSWQTLDEESGRLLQAFLDNVYGQRWREQHTGSTYEGTEQRASGAMSIEEAFQILGLEPDASKEEIIAAHKKLMQKLHPDRGGSNYLAVKINQAKDILLERKS